MKKVFIVLIFAGLFLTGSTSFAQTPIKLGHIDSRLLYAAMPESDSANKQYQREVENMQKTLEELQAKSDRSHVVL